MAFMEITRRYQLKAIHDGVERLGITKHGLEAAAKVRHGTIADLIRGRTDILRADKWQKIADYLGMKPRDQEIDAILSILKVLFQAVAQERPIRSESIIPVLGLIQERYGAKKEAVGVIDDLISFLQEDGKQSDAEIFSQLLRMKATARKAED